ncbi:NAD(P)H-binding protein [Niabella beijingensis]|uniref:NAD(P)H-binding protein n=1 Tax=Niabella beijingensis TaxID=2872700 RepID=UPI001CBE8A5E|nr:NAD(P)H-binding protein [Niabella beijingensis]MBZ4187982.1 NAD(P)H-binding protein [Niabella beijingensis]
MGKKTAAIVGSGGLIGSHLLRHLLDDREYGTIRTLMRWPAAPTHPRQEEKLVDFNDAESILLALTDVDVVFCAIGTTLKKVGGDKKRYWQIDHDIPLRVCRMALEAGCREMAMVSAIGANSNSSNFYLQLKGKTEEDLIATGIPVLHLMQPSLLLGDRNEKRRMEAISQRIMKPASALLSGSWSKYKAIDAGDVARAMIEAVRVPRTGVFRYTWKEMMELSDQYTSDS